MHVERETNVCKRNLEYYIFEVLKLNGKLVLLLIRKQKNHKSFFNRLKKTG